MGKYVVALFSDLCKHSDAWNRIPGEQMAGLMGEYKALAENVADQYGCFHRNFTGDGHLFLFENADAAVRFALKLLAAWHDAFAAFPALEGLQPIPLRVGAHFGEDTEIGNGEAWVGRANNMANRIQGLAKPDTVLVSESMLDLIDFARYEIESVAACKLEGDCVARRTLYRVDSFDEAASAAKPPHELTAEDWFLRAVAMVGTEKENTEEEEACYVEALRLRPDYAEAHNAYGVLLQERGDAEGAEEHYLEALRLRPDASQPHNNYAVLLNERGDLAAAEEHYKEALRLRPDGPEVHSNYAALLEDKGEVAGAEKHYLEALQVRPDYAKAHYNYAVLLQKRRDVKRADVKSAKQHYVQALRLRSDYPEAHNNYAVLLEEGGGVKGAEEHYLEALRLRPDYAEAHNNYAGLLKATGDLEGAEEHYLEALRLCPDDAAVHYNYAGLLKDRGDVDGAEQHYRKAYELDPAHSQIKSAFEEHAWER